MPSIRRSIPLLFTALLAVSCASSGFRATHDYDSSNDFSVYQSWAWISDEPMKVGPMATVSNPLLEPRIMSAIDSALTAKGYRKVEDRSAAQFVVSFTVGSREEIDVDSYPSMSANIGYANPRHWRWGGAYYGFGAGTETTVRQYTRGILAIDVFDVEERRPVWHGKTEKRIRDSDREAPEAAIKAAVDAVLAGFPAN